MTDELLTALEAVRLGFLDRGNLRLADELQDLVDEVEQPCIQAREVGWSRGYRDGYEVGHADGKKGRPGHPSRARGRRCALARAVARRRRQAAAGATQ